MIAADRSKYLQFILTDPRHCGKNSFYTATDALLTLEAEVVKPEEPTAEREERKQKQIERLPVLGMLRKYGLGENREHLLLVGKPGSGKSTTLQRLCVELAEIALADDLEPIPIFVQLKGDKPILTLIQAEFRRAKLRVTAEQIDDLLLEDRLVLLLDGVNEISSKELRQELQNFRENNLTTPTIFTTRDLTVGGSLGIDRRLEMRPLTEEQMREFVLKYLPEYGDKLLGQLRDRLREIAETPLLLKMLCEVFEPATGQIPQNKAELFELFDRKYQRHKEGVSVSDESSLFQSDFLQYIAFEMLRGDAQKPTEAWLTLPIEQAERVLEDWLRNRGETDSPSKVKKWLRDLIKHHLLQVAADPQQIEFHHQLFQEYYAARHLRSMLQDKHSDLVDDDRFKHFYLNYLKWTEPLGLLLGLLDDEAQVLRLVRLGLEVDWFLGARLAGDVKQGFQPQTVGLVNRLIGEKDLPQWLKFELWEKTRSSAIIPELLLLLQDSDSDFQWRASAAIKDLGDKSHVPYLLPLLQHSDPYVRKSAVGAIQNLGDKSHVPYLLPLRQDPQFWVRQSVVYAIQNLGDRSNVPDLLPMLQDPNFCIRWIVVTAIIVLGDRRNFSISSHFLKIFNVDLKIKMISIRRYSFMWVLSFFKCILLWVVGLLCILFYFILYVFLSLTKVMQLAAIQIKNESEILSSVEKASEPFADKNNVSELLPLLQDSDSDMRREVINELVNLADKINVSDLLPLLQDSDSGVRSKVAEAISKLGNNSNVADLLPLLQDSDYIVRSVVVESVFKLGEGSNLLELSPLLADSEHIDILTSILAIQAKCEFYNYEVFCSSLPPIKPSQIGSIVYGDYVAGNKIQGDKIAGNKTENNFPIATEVKIFENVDQYYQTPSPQKDSSS